jgi:hypothetical protein
MMRVILFAISRGYMGRLRDDTVNTIWNLRITFAAVLANELQQKPMNSDCPDAFHQNILRSLI